MNFSIFLVLELLLVLGRLNYLMGDAVPSGQDEGVNSSKSREQLQGHTATFPGYLPMSSLVEPHKDTSEFWRATEILKLVHSKTRMMETSSECREDLPSQGVHPPSRRSVRPICRASGDYQLCPQCAHLNNFTECELFRDSCKERRVDPSERSWYCQRKYGKWRSVLIPADYSQCQCCDECVLYRELDQSCVPDEYDFNIEEFLPVTSIDFRAGCNPYWGHPDQAIRALRCDKALRRCVPANAPEVAKEIIPTRRNSRYEPVPSDCPSTCRGYKCQTGTVEESHCKPGAFLPDRDSCNCCGHCSQYQQLDEKCAEFRKTEHEVNGTKEVEVEEEFLEPGCDDGLVCRQGYCQDIHQVHSPVPERRVDDEVEAYEPCKRELNLFKKKYGPDGHLHYNAPQCTPLWLYSPVQCRGFVCYCSLEDGTFIQGIKVPRVEVSNMNCDCAREKCRTNSDVECDGYGNYQDVVFSAHDDDSKNNNMSAGHGKIAATPSDHLDRLSAVSTLNPNPVKSP